MVRRSRSDTVQKSGISLDQIKQVLSGIIKSAGEANIQPSISNPLGAKTSEASAEKPEPTTQMKIKEKVINKVATQLGDDAVVSLQSQTPQQTIDAINKILPDNPSTANKQAVAGPQGGLIVGTARESTPQALNAQQASQQDKETAQKIIQSLLKQGQPQQSPSQNKKQFPLTFEERLQGKNFFGRFRVGFSEGLLRSAGINRSAENLSAKQARDKLEKVDFKNLAREAKSKGEVVPGFTVQETNILAELKNKHPNIKMTASDLQNIASGLGFEPGVFSLFSRPSIEKMNKEKPEIFKTYLQQFDLMPSGSDTAKQAVSETKGKLRNFSSESEARKAGFKNGDRVSIGGQSGKLN